MDNTEIQREKEERNTLKLEDLLEVIDFNERDQDKGDALLEAVEHENEDQVELLLSKKVNINIRNCYGCSPLILACEKGNERMVRMLVEKGADVNQNDREPSCTYQYPYTQGQREITDLINENGFIRTHSYGLTPLMLAAIGEHVNIAKILIQQKDINLNQKDICGNNALTYASLKGNLQISELLITAGIDSYNKNIHEKNALHLACEYGHLDIVRLLASKIQLIDLNQQDSVGYTAFSYACLIGHKEIVEFLISKNADINLENKAGRTPITIAYLNARKDVVRVLIKNNVKLDIKLRFLDSMVGLLETDEQKECFLLIRNALLRSLYDFIHNPTSQQLRENTINLLQPSIDQTQNIFELDYYFAFKSINRDDRSSYVDLVKDEEMKRVFAYFSTYEFKEKFIEDILNSLKDQLELMNVGKSKLMRYIVSSGRDLSDEFPIVVSDIDFNFRTLKTFILNDDLAGLIKLEDDEYLKELEILKLRIFMDKMILSIQEKLNQAQDLYDSIGQAHESLASLLDNDD
jgi:ankyrin repeat protein